MTARNVSDMFGMTCNPCFISTSGSCKVDVTDSMIVGNVGRLSSSTVFTFHGCTFRSDERITKCLDSPIPANQNGLQRFMYVDGSGTFSNCILGGGFVMLGGKGGGVKRCASVYTFHSCSFVLSPEQGVKTETPIVLNSDNTVVNFTGETRITLPSDPKMYNKDCSALLCPSVPWNMFHVKGTITLCFEKSDATTHTASDACAGFMRNMRFFRDGTESKPMFRCIDPKTVIRRVSETSGTQEEYEDIPMALSEILLRKSSYTLEIKPNLRTRYTIPFCSPTYLHCSLIVLALTLGYDMQSRQWNELSGWDPAHWIYGPGGYQRHYRAEACDRVAQHQHHNTGVCLGFQRH